MATVRVLHRGDRRRSLVSGCFFARYAITNSAREMAPCAGRLVRCHLIPQRLLRTTAEYRLLRTRASREHFLYDDRLWVWGCGGLTGLSGHHGAFDSARTIRVPRVWIPAGTEQAALELGLLWYLDRAYGGRA
jgi:hypothetical protein